MTVSVIIPNYNHSRYLKQRINSVLNQTYKDFELIILDDFSSDNSCEIINEYVAAYPDIITNYNEFKTGGPFVQWNTGVKMARGNFIWIAESDDSSDSDFLEKTVSIMEQSENTGLVFCDSKIFNERRGIEYLSSERVAFKKCLREFSGDRKVSLRTFLENPIVNASSVLFRKSTYVESGWADPSMKFCGDWLLYIKMMLRSDIKYIPEPLNIFRLHSGSTYHNYYRSNIFMIEKIKIYFYMIREAKFSVIFYFLVVKKIIKVLFIRLINFFRIQSFLIPDLPRVPKTAKYEKE